jgi:putative transposase
VLPSLAYRCESWQNPWIESFNARFRGEVLDCELFSSILEARVTADVWRDTYNRDHPHSSLGMLAPAVSPSAGGPTTRRGGHELIDAPAGYGSRRPITTGSLD